MDHLMLDWALAVDRVNELRDRMAALALAQLAVPPDMHVQLAQLEEEVLVKLRALYRAGGADDG